MMSLIEATTERLLLRQWKDADVPVFAKINADPEVMEFFPGVLSEDESDDMAQIIRVKISINGWGFWAVERRDDNKFLGFVGLNAPHYELPVSPCIEIGWRLGREYWGNGYASEAARKCLEIAFKRLNLCEVYSFTSVLNLRSRAVMERIGMTNTFHNFEHPVIPEQHRLREHVLYKIERDNWALAR
jgi:RimJ/RimL family protein N-acetyltransferase